MDRVEAGGELLEGKAVSEIFGSMLLAEKTSSRPWESEREREVEKEKAKFLETVRAGSDEEGFFGL